MAGPQCLPRAWLPDMPRHRVMRDQCPGLQRDQWVKVLVCRDAGGGTWGFPQREANPREGKDICTG